VPFNQAVQLPTFLLLLAPLTVFLLAVLALFFNGIRIKRLVRSAETDRHKELSVLVHELIRSVSPRIVFCATPEDVAKEAASLVDAARRAFEDRLQKKESSELGGSHVDSAAEPESDYRENDFVVFYGAAAIGEGDTEGAHLYRKAVDDAMSSGMRVRRYVHLLSPDDLKGRSDPIANTFLAWIGRQYDELMKSPDAFLINNVRAPQWGAANANLVTNAGLLEIKAGGQSALAVYDPAIAATMRRSMRTELNAARLGNRTEYSRSDTAAMKKLRALIFALCDSKNRKPSEFSRELDGDKPDA